MLTNFLSFTIVAQRKLSCFSTEKFPNIEMAVNDARLCNKQVEVSPLG